MDLQQHNEYGSKPKSSTKQLELHVASVYSEIAEMIKEKGDLEIEMPIEVPTAVERVNLIKSVLAYLLDQAGSDPFSSQKAKNNYKAQADEQNSIECTNCENYEKNLQKLECQIRNHIRTHQQLKLYQDGLQEKIQQSKKQKKQFDKKYETIKKKYDEAKLIINGNSQKVAKIEQQNQKLRNQLRQFKQTALIQEPKKQLNRYESNKQNLSEWRNSNFNERDRERISVEKRPDSTERQRVSVNVRSTKGIPISSKIVQEKAKQQKTKILKSRLGF